MYNFHFAKIVAGVGPLLAKETILSKVINMVDVFRISLSGGFDDNNKKYIETILKLDNSKTIMMETRGADLRVKNTSSIVLKKKDIIFVDYSEYAQEGDARVYIDYAQLDKIPVGTIIRLRQSGVLLEMKKIVDDQAECVVLQGGTINPYDRVVFDNFQPTFAFLTERDKKDLQRGLAHGIHIVAASYVKHEEDITHLRAFLSVQHKESMKVYAKIETPESIKNLDAIITAADGILISLDIVAEVMKEHNLSDDDIISKCKEAGKPIIIHYAENVTNDNYPFMKKDLIKHYCHRGVDGYSIETLIHEDDPLRVASSLFEHITDFALEPRKIDLTTFYKDSDFIIRDYIIYNAYRIIQELEVKAIVCYTHNGYTTARLAALNPTVPIIAFTSIDETYRYINTLRAVKGFKISPNFNYENLKRIGKEMIRIIFKGNISLDDKIVIVQANEIAKDEKTDMINGVELYKFKNI